MTRRGEPTFIARYRWWLFLGAIAGNIVLRVAARFSPELGGVYLVFDILSGVPFVMGIAGFISHARSRRWLEADNAARLSEEGTGE